MSHMAAYIKNKQKYKLEDRHAEQADTDRQKHPEDVCPVVLPSLVQSGLHCWAELGWAPLHTMLLCLCSELLHISSTHNSTLWYQRSPEHSSQRLTTVPCWAHSLSLTLVAQPEATNSQWGQRGHADIWCHTHESTRTHLTYMKMNTHHLIRQEPSRPLAALREVTRVTQLLYLTVVDDRGCDGPVN